MLPPVSISFLYLYAWECKKIDSTIGLKLSVLKGGK